MRLQTISLRMTYLLWGRVCRFARVGATGAAALLRPPDARCGRLHGEYLARSFPVGHVRRATPLGRHQEQCALVRASEHAREAAAVQLDRLQHRTPFADAHAPLVGNDAVPDGAVRVEADAVRGAAGEVGPYPPVR